MNQSDDRPDAVNWDPPNCEPTVQRALENGLTDPAEIARWAKEQYGVEFSLDQIRAALQALKHPRSSHHSRANP